MSQAATEARVKEVVLRILGEIAPEVDLASVDPTVNFRDQVDIDSVDFLNFVVAVDHELGIAIPEGDYGKLRTLESCIIYLAARSAG